jgi:hypothetical protein
MLTVEVGNMLVLIDVNINDHGDPVTQSRALPLMMVSLVLPVTRCCVLKMFYI